MGGEEGIGLCQSAPKPNLWTDRFRMCKREMPSFGLRRALIPSSWIELNRNLTSTGLHFSPDERTLELHP